MRTSSLWVVTLAVSLAACNKPAGPAAAKAPPQPSSQPPRAAAAPLRPSQGALPRMPGLELAADERTPQKIELGHALFFEPQLSVDGSKSCYSCHQNEDGNGGKEPTAVGPKGPLPRHSPVIWNVAFFKNAFYWDGRSPTLEAQAKAAWAGGNMAVGEDGLAGKVSSLGKLPRYKRLFEAAFPGQAPSPDLVTAALAEYERTLVCDGTAYDRFAAGDRGALGEAAQRGLDVFMGKGQCAVCHAPPFFSSAMNVEGGVYFNVGIGTQGKPEAEVDVGRMKVTNNPADWAAFKPPSLRNVGKSAPYFHDGSVATLEEAVKLMASGGIANKNRTPLLADRQLSEDELADLVAFLRTLECGTLAPPAGADGG